MARGKRYQPEQVVNLLRQIEVAVANGKTGEQRARAAMPPLPGAATISVTSGDCLSAQMMACSRPPPPMTRAFMCLAPPSPPCFAQNIDFAWFSLGLRMQNIRNEGVRCQNLDSKRVSLRSGAGDLVFLSTLSD